MDAIPFLLMRLYRFLNNIPFVKKRRKKNLLKKRKNAELTRGFMRIAVYGLSVLADTVVRYPNSTAGTSR